jgi:AraC-like DNA-binding protein
LKLQDEHASTVNLKEPLVSRLSKDIESRGIEQAIQALENAKSEVLVGEQGDSALSRKLSPHPSLSPYVDSYWYIEGNPDTSVRQKSAVMYPLGYPLIEFNLADKWMMRPRGSDELTTHSSNIMHLASDPFWIRPIGRIRSVVVRLHPLALKKLIPGEVTKDIIVDPELVFGGIFKETEERIALEGRWKEMKTHLDRFFVHVFETSRVGIDYRVRNAVSAIISQKGKVFVRDLVEELSTSQKRIEQLFREHIGMSPKAYVGIARFQNVLASYHPGMSLTELSHAAGYHDQSHLIRYFKKFTGSPPRPFFMNELVETHKISNLYNFSR